MSTIPFIQVEGAIALPRMRPLDRFPVTFGREWTLTPPHFSLSAEIRALYAAIMRTVCLSAEAFREACRWDLQRHLFPAPCAAPVRPSVSAGASPPPARTKTLPPADAARTAGLRPAPASSGTHKLAGGACAIGGAALLAWIIASHTPHGEQKATVPDAPPIRAAGDTASQRLADMRAAHDDTAAPAHASSQRAAVETPKTSQGIEATHPSAQHVASTDASAVAASSGARSSASEPGYAAANHPVVSPRATLSGRMVSGPRVESSRHHARARAESVETHRTLGAYPEATDYSPRQPSASQGDDYASINTFASTYAAPHRANRPSVPVDSTDWTNHVSQRRVTEVPDRFGQ
jgi:hypothetical protein